MAWRFHFPIRKYDFNVVTWSQLTISVRQAGIPSQHDVTLEYDRPVLRALRQS